MRMPRPFHLLGTSTIALTLASVVPLAAQSTASTPLGYYRYPAIHDTTIVFTAEGDLWTIGLGGGIARRLTSGRGEVARWCDHRVHRRIRGARRGLHDADRGWLARAAHVGRQRGRRGGLDAG